MRAGKDFRCEYDHSGNKMSHTAIILSMTILVAMSLVAGCTEVPQWSPLPDGQPDPVVGIWSSQDLNRTTVYRFWANGTFDAWSHSGNIPPRYIYQSYGEWKPAGLHAYTTEGPHIGYGDVTALAIWRKLTLVYEPTRDTLSIPVYQNPVLSRLSHDPDAPLNTSHSLP